jgi:hypothetical protein
MMQAEKDKELLELRKRDELLSKANSKLKEKCLR